MSRKGQKIISSSSEVTFMDIKIGETLSILMKQKRITLKELSTATGVSSSTLHEWKSNRKPKDPAQVQAVACYLGVTMHHILFGCEDPNETIQQIIKQDIFSGVFEINIKRVKLNKGDQ